ncbi:MAG TPA: hypothetical protein PLY93_05125 [Turneriella sp.]|nr:hypothetical protein [Turneriella sp.]
MSHGEQENDGKRIAGDDEWSRVGEYLDRLAFENDRLEQELKIKKERRAAREAESFVFQKTVMGNSTQFNEAHETTLYEARTIATTTDSMHVSYDALRGDLKGLIADLNDFRSSCAGLESRLGNS